jgi:hypothetical protein
VDKGSRVLTKHHQNLHLNPFERFVCWKINDQ